MTEKARNFWVGTFVLTSGLVLGSLMVWFGEVPDWIISSEWSLRITGVHELSGVGEGSSVNLNGVEIGRVRTIGFVNAQQPDQGVVITAGIKQDFSVPTDAVAHIYGATLGFGMGHIDIVPSPNVSAQPIPRKNAEIQGEMKSKIAELISRETIDAIEKTITQIGDLAAAATPVAKNLGDIFEQRGISQVEAPGAAQRGVIANISTVLERLDRFIANLNVMLGDENLQEDVKSGVGNLKDATEELRQKFSSGEVIIWTEPEGCFKVQRVTPDRLVTVPGCNKAVKALINTGYLEPIFPSLGWRVLERGDALVERQRFTASPFVNVERAQASPL
ncbi:MAG: MCE family protein [Planctomycetes bacterium]|nr:MCE family protein [Planctomycetota bacterium]